MNKYKSFKQLGDPNTWGVTITFSDGIQHEWYNSTWGVIDGHLLIRSWELVYKRPWWTLWSGLQQGMWKEPSKYAMVYAPGHWAQAKVFTGRKS